MKSLTQTINESKESSEMTTALLDAWDDNSKLSDIGSKMEDRSKKLGLEDSQDYYYRAYLPESDDEWMAVDKEMEKLLKAMDKEAHSMLKKDFSITNKKAADIIYGELSGDGPFSSVQQVIDNAVDNFKLVKNWKK